MMHNTFTRNDIVKKFKHDSMWNCYCPLAEMLFLVEEFSISPLQTMMLSNSEGAPQPEQ